MPNSTRYFQLTPDILLEYRYSDIDLSTNQAGDKNAWIFDSMNNDEGVSIIKNVYDGSKNFVFGNDEEGLVFPMNSSESRFIQYNESDKKSFSKVDFKDELTEDNCDFIYDNIRIHFTSGAYFGSYDGLILRSYIYDKMKNKISLFSHIIKKNDNVVINENPMLINQNLYTTYLDFRLPSANAFVNLYKEKKETQQTPYVEEKPLRKALRYRYDLMENTPLVFNIYGIKTIYKDVLDISEKYITEKLNSIYVPITDSYNNIFVDIEDATDGDYFKIKTRVSDNGVSFSDFIYNLSNGHPEIYVILHELTLTEWYAPIGNEEPISIVTHREHYIANAGDDDGNLNENGLEHVMIYRPVIMNAGEIEHFTIEDQLKIINTYDNTTIVKMSTKDCYSPKKYGKHMNKINLGSIPAQVNVYNKRPDDDLDNVKITNSSSNVKIENHQHTITSFIECVNVGVSIEQVPVDVIEMQ